MGQNHEQALAAHVLAEQLDAHYRQIPAMVAAQSLGGLFTAWVLWHAVDDRTLLFGLGALLLLSSLRVWLYRVYRAQQDHTPHLRRWQRLAVGASFVSGCIWGGAAPLLYPPIVAGYEVYLLVLLTLLPIVPVAALAVHMPAFWAYYLPCITPFIATLLAAGGRPEVLTAVLLLMMMGAMVTFALRYARGLTQAIELRWRLNERTHALEAAMAQKTRFIAAASHDLRQPVHSMSLFVEALRGAQGQAAADEAVGYIGQSLKSLRRMLDDLLEVSRLDAAVVVAQPRRVALQPLFERLRAEFEPLAAQQGLRFVCRARQGWARSDAALLERMLRNLLANALKFTRHGGVALVCRGGREHLRLQVIDTGSGIRAEHWEAIFEEFAQIDSDDRTDARGLGLGLAIVQRLARLLGHTVSVRSNPGRGSTFTIGLARGSADAEDHTHHETVKEAAPRAPVGAWVVVVDDDPSVCAAVAALLAQWGHRALCFASAAQAIAGLERVEARPQLLIVDYRLMRGESGLDAVVALRQALGQALALPAIVVTGDTAPERIRESYAAGHTLLHKPVDPSRLRTAVDAALLSGAVQAPAWSATSHG